MNKNIAVIGAGISGLLAAYYLSKDGYKVTVFEQEIYPAMRTSYANGGQVSVSNSEVWTTWSNVFKGIKWLFKKDAPLLIRPAPSVSKIKWMLKFLWNTIKGSYTTNTSETILLGLESRKLYKEIVDEEGIKYDQSLCGILHFYKDQSYFQKAIDAKEIYNNNGCEWDILNADQTKNADAALADVTGIVGGVWTANDHTGDIHKFCYQLSKILETKYNVEFKFNEQISTSYDLKVLEDCYDAIVVSAGVGSEKLANKIGDSLDVYPVKGYSITINVQTEDLKYIPTVSLLDDQAKIVTSTLGNRFRVAGTAELAGENYDIRRDRIEPLLNWVHTNFPNINTQDYAQWACLRPMTPNMMPIVRQSQYNNKVFYHTGHGHLGWTVSPATAKQLLNLIKNTG